MSNKIYLGTDSIIEIEGLRDANDNLIISATVEVSLFYSNTSIEVEGQTWPRVMVHNENGNYSTTLSKNLNLDKSDKITAKVVATDSSKQATFYKVLNVVKNTF